jgi:chemotaxis protein methyltransferase CheR
MHSHTREFHFTEQDFQRIRKLIYEHAGISLSENKQELVYSRLARRLRATYSAATRRNGRRSPIR